MHTTKEYTEKNTAFRRQIHDTGSKLDTSEFEIMGVVLGG